MREILFRGKRVRNGEWIYGSLIAMDSDISSSQVFIFPPYKGASSLPCSFLVSNNMEEVDPETIGQYTGLTDKNGKKIFEGDIIKTRHGIRYITFVDGCFGAKPNIRLFADLRQYNRELNGEWEIIGNIHDNPELLGGADNGE